MRRSWFLDALERVVWTGLQAGSGIIIATNSFDLITLKAAGIAAGLAVVKCIAARGVGSSNDASTLP